jgi:hypothetical protein
MSGQLHAPVALPPEKEPPGPIGWVGPRTSVDDVEKREFFTLPGLELGPLGRPARSQSLYRLSYPGSRNLLSIVLMIMVLEYAHVPHRSHCWLR